MHTNHRAGLLHKAGESKEGHDTFFARDWMNVISLGLCWGCVKTLHLRSSGVIAYEVSQSQNTMIIFSNFGLATDLKDSNIFNKESKNKVVTCVRTRILSRKVERPYVVHRAQKARSKAQFPELTSPPDNLGPVLPQTIVWHR